MLGLGTRAIGEMQACGLHDGREEVGTQTQAADDVIHLPVGEIAFTSPYRSASSPRAAASSIQAILGIGHVPFREWFTGALRLDRFHAEPIAMDGGPERSASWTTYAGDRRK